jgi:hypothetical protein
LARDESLDHPFNGGFTPLGGLLLVESAVETGNSIEDFWGFIAKFE